MVNAYSFKTIRNNFFLLSLIFFSLVFFNNAWVAEDAFITFRAVDNLLAGNGPVWNVGERVQVYTHPLWYLFVSIGTAIWHQSYYIVLILSYLCLIGFLFCLSNLAAQKFIKINLNDSFAKLMIILPFIFLLLSRAFVDYSSSGLENPLLHLLIAIYVVFYISDYKIESKFLVTSLIFNLVFLTRQDSILVVLPASMFLFYQVVKAGKPWISLCLIAVAPTLIWEIYSLIYYGSFVPNTALAKLNIDFERSRLLRQSRHFFEFNLREDPLTSVTILLGVVGAFLNKNVVAKLLMIGVALQLIYITWVGADYMLGRFLSTSLVVSVISLLILQIDTDKIVKVLVSLYAIIIAGLFLVQYPYTLKYSKDFESHSFFKGMADERGFYFQSLGLVPVIMKHNFNYQTNTLFYMGREMKTYPYAEACVIGMVGWANQGSTYLTDPLALGDAFLARLPANNQFYRPGHYQRSYPDGYPESIVSHTNEIKAPVLAKLYNDIELVTRNNLWSKARWSAIYRLNTGYYKHLDKYFLRNKSRNCISYIHKEDI